MRFGDFDREEFRFRSQRLQAALGRHGIDVLLVTQPENCRYFAGTLAQGWVVKSYQFPSLLPADAKRPAMTFVGWGDEHIAATSWIDEVRHYEWTNGWNTALAVPQAIAGAVKELGLARGTIGLELSEEF